MQDQREIAVEGAGRVFVISGSAHSPQNDWLLIYEASSGAELARVALTSTPAGYPEYYAQHPGCNAMLADCGENGSINALDIDPFVSLLTGG